MNRALPLLARSPAPLAQLALRGLIALPALLALPACPAGPGDDDDDVAAEGAGEGEGNTAFRWELRDDVGVPSLWGAIVAEGRTADEAFVLGGGAGDSAPVITEVQDVAVIDGRVRSTSTVTIDGPRFCGCALFDGARDEVVVVGGRDNQFFDVESSFVLDLATGTRTAVVEAPPDGKGPGGGPSAFPIGCQAFFADVVDRGYVFSGLSSNQGFFGGDTWVWDPEARTFTALPPTREAVPQPATTRACTASTTTAS